MNIAKVSKAIASGIGAAVAGFTIPAVTDSKLSILGDIAAAIIAGIVGFETTYWAPKNSTESLLDN